jgi:hypothetical protein
MKYLFEAIPNMMGGGFRILEQEEGKTEIIQIGVLFRHKDAQDYVDFKNIREVVKSRLRAEKKGQLKP